jgi:hypothetical protein
VDIPSGWHAGPLIWAMSLYVGVVGLVFLVWLVWLFLASAGVEPFSTWTRLERPCAQFNASCGVVVQILWSPVVLAGGLTFLLWRLWRVERWYRQQARDHAQDLVPTAGTDIDEVVGRDELCAVVMEDLHDRRQGRPHVLVGGVGTGKTAVLVRLTQRLAEEGAIPVPIWLHDVDRDLDFERLGRESFANTVDRRLVSAAEGEKIWRRLRADSKIVVLADGLEEAFIGTAVEPERNTLIRVAIEEAYRQKLPLVIASRPHDPLRGTEAAIMELEPLSDEAALAYIEAESSAEDARRLDWIVETAEVVEVPLYLHLTRELQRHGLLVPTSLGQGCVFDTRGDDRSVLRLELLQTWERAVVRGQLRPNVALSPAQRQATFEHLSALACLGLRQDRLDVEFKDSAEDRAITAEVKRRLGELEPKVEGEQQSGIRDIDVRLAATWGAQLTLVNARGQGVRFPHSLIQAYLGSRLMGAALRDASCADALRGLHQGREAYGPSREFLIALVLRSRAIHEFGLPSRRPPPGVDAESDAPGGLRDAASVPDDHAESDILGRLREAVSVRKDNKALDLYAAILEIDCIAEQPAHAEIATEIRRDWPSICAGDPQTLEEGKLGLVRRFGEAVRAIDDRRRDGGKRLAEPAYLQLYAIGCQEPSYPIRHAVAKEIGAGGEAARHALNGMLATPGSADLTGLGLGEACESDPNHQWRATIMNAWLAPTFVGSPGSSSGDDPPLSAAKEARDYLSGWVMHVRDRGEHAAAAGRAKDEPGTPISQEIALAQGFKYVANWRPPYPHAPAETRTFLYEQAMEMLKGSRYWFSQLTLIQALCLWTLSDESKHHDPRATVGHWLKTASCRQREQAPSDREPAVHPFVREAAELAKRAIETRRPAEFCWIDESGVVARVGSRTSGSGTTHRKHSLWIPPSTGWSALDSRAQRLVADVLLLLNLAERGDRPTDRERRLERADQPFLPPCLTHDRSPLDPGRTVGTADTYEPGTGCADGCSFELCPYPPKGTQPPRVELTEAFCRRQQTLSGTFAGKAPWQKMRSARLERFWARMADRARGSSPTPL